MKKVLKRTGGSLHHFVGGIKKYGKNPSMYGDCTGLSGNCTGVLGKCTGVFGKCTGVISDLDKAGITDLERRKGLDIRDLILR